jgi:probable HAF family extracellular repeat protein
MKTSYSSRISSFVLASILMAGLGFASQTLAGFRSFIVDPNSKMVTDIGSLGGIDAYGRGINDAGQVVGWSRTAEGNTHAFITGPKGEGMTDIGTLGGSDSWAYGINATGQVVGRSLIAGDGSYHAFITGPNGIGMTDLGTLGGSNSWAYAINAAGQAAGISLTTDNSSRAFITGPGGSAMTDLGTLGGDYSAAHGINEAGRVVGDSFISNGNQHAFITGPNGVDMVDINALGGETFANGINSTGRTVGQSDSHAFITGANGAGMTDLGTLGGDESVAFGVNDAGQVVGSAQIAGTPQLPQGDMHAFSTAPGGVGMSDLNLLVVLPGGFLSEAHGINNSGLVVASGFVASIPEPASYALMIGGLILLGFMVQGKKQLT